MERKGTISEERELGVIKGGGGKNIKSKINRKNVGCNLRKSHKKTQDEVNILIRLGQSVGPRENNNQGQASIKEGLGVMCEVDQTSNVGVPIRFSPSTTNQ